MERSHHAFQFDAFVVAGIFSARDDHAALALGDGSVHLLPSVSEPKLRTVAVHQGTILSLSQDISPDAFLSGGEDGRFIRITAAGTVQELACFGGRWVDHVAASPTLGLRACSVGKWVYLYEENGNCAMRLEHASTVGGLAFSAQGDRLAVAHYGGVTVWKAGKKRWKAEKFQWRGSHIGVTWSPDDQFLIISMQENALHGWRLQDRMDMQMSGYPRKVRAWAWSYDGYYLITTGTNRAVCWPFKDKDGPMGRTPLEGGRGGPAACYGSRKSPALSLYSHRLSGWAYAPDGSRGRFPLSST
jgi:WD40 repeat protein